MLLLLHAYILNYNGNQATSTAERSDILETDYKFIKEGARNVDLYVLH